MSYCEATDFQEKEAAFRVLQDDLQTQNAALAGANILEIGGSGGLYAGLIAREAGRVWCTDVVDWNEAYGGIFPSLLKEKFERNGRLFDFSKVEFAFGDAQQLIYKEDCFDLVVSLNAFEHIPSPVLALKEAIRVLKPGGYAHLNFDPVWTADSGSHFLDSIGEPWAHLIYSDDRICDMMRQSGAEEGETLAFRRDMNRLPVNYYREQFPVAVEESGAEIVSLQSWSGVVDPSFLSHPNLQTASRKLGCSEDDLLVRGFRFLIRKK